MPIPLQSSVVYGPVSSRRLGNSLGINVLPTDIKFCHSNCIYCQYGWTDLRAMQKTKLQTAQELVAQIEAGFKQHAKSGLRIDSITFSGNGEPTLHPEIGTLIQEVKKLRSLYFPAIPVTILSDSSRVHLPEVREALEELDERYMKFDAGDQENYQKINNPVVKINWNAMVEGLGRLPQVTLQSLFISAPVDNASGAGLDNWLAALAEIRPRELHVYTAYRSTADDRVRKVDQKRLSEIAEMASRVTDLRTVTTVTETYVELV